MGKTRDLRFEGELSRKAETMIHTLFFFFLKTYKVLSSPGIDGVGEIRPC